MSPRMQLAVIRLALYALVVFIIWCALGLSAPTLWFALGFALLGGAFGIWKARSRA